MSGWGLNAREVGDLRRGMQRSREASVQGCQTGLLLKKIPPYAPKNEEKENKTTQLQLFHQRLRAYTALVKSERWMCVHFDMLL